MRRQLCGGSGFLAAMQWQFLRETCLNFRGVDGKLLYGRGVGNFVKSEVWRVGKPSKFCQNLGISAILKVVDTFMKTARISRVFWCGESHTQTLQLYNCVVACMYANFVLQLYE